MDLVVSNLAAMKGVRVLFSQLSFEAKGGDFLVVRGGNGSGKTTLLRMLAGLARPQAGEISWSGEGSDSPMSELHYCGHLNGLKPGETPKRHLEFWSDFSGANRDEIAPALEGAGLTRLKELPSRVLSAGQKRRVALARLFVSQRSVWVLDEPAAALDTAGKAWLSGAITQHVSKGGLVIAALHEPLDCRPTSELDLMEYSK